MAGCAYGVRAFTCFFVAVVLGHQFAKIIWTWQPAASQVPTELNEQVVKALGSVKEKLFTPLGAMKTELLVALTNCTAAQRIKGEVPPANADEYIRTGLAMRIAEEVKEEMKQVHWNKSLDDLLPDRGGVPLQLLLVGHWRSGSSFVGELLESHPGTNYVFEPLVYLLDDHQLRGGPLVEQSKSALKAMFDCRYRDLGNRFMQNYISYIWIFSHSRRLRECRDLREVCSDLEFLSKTCRSCPVQLIKTVRLRLHAISEHLLDKGLSNMKVVYLSRDPRAIMNSRLPINWCVRGPECANVTALCEDLKEEFYIARELKAKFPDRFLVLQYESLVKDYWGVTRELFQFLGLEFTDATATFLRTHTTQSKGSRFSTYRDGKQAIHWDKELGSNHSLLENIQNACMEAMKLWGYKAVEVGSSKIV